MAVEASPTLFFTRALALNQQRHGDHYMDKERDELTNLYKAYPRLMLKSGSWLALDSSDEGEVVWYYGFEKRSGLLSFPALW